MQAWPLPYFAVQAPLRQRPLTQSASAAHVGDLQAVVDAQTTPPWQAEADGIEQLPAPLHVPVMVSCPPLQEVDPQLTLEVE